MGIKVQDADALRPTHLGNRRRIRPRDGVIATENDRDRTRLSNLANLAIDGAVAVFKSTWVDLGVASINGGECRKRLHAHLQRVQRAGLVLRLTNGARAEPCARTMCDRIIKRCADDGDVGLATTDLSDILNPRELSEAHRPNIRRTIEWVALLWGAVPAERGEGGGEGAQLGQLGGRAAGDAPDRVGRLRGRGSGLARAVERAIGEAVWPASGADSTGVSLTPITALLAALATVGFIVTVARTHQPLGILVSLSLIHI